MDLEHLRQWIGRRELGEDRITPAPLAQLRATLDQEPGSLAAGEPLPPLAHWLYFLPRHRQSELGPDGHARRGGFLPPVPLPRRMWAGGRLGFLRPLRIGDEVRRISTILDVDGKQGRSGPLVFVRVEHRIESGGVAALIEEHDIVYRGADRDGLPAAPVVDGEPASWREEIRADDVLLFRYSALTFNGHRIHYDRKYATGTEGYPGLVVHGPLLATLLADLALRHNGGLPLRRFAFRAERPVFDIEPFSLNGRAGGSDSAVLWVLAANGQRAMSAEAYW